MHPIPIALLGTLLSVRLLVESSTPQLLGACPERCQCDFSEKFVDCSDAGLDEIPFTVPSDTKVLVLAGNNITHINLDIVEGLTSLRRLDLSENNISELPPLLLDSLPRLASLKVDGNPMESIPVLTHAQHRLVHFSANACRLRRVDAHIFSHLRHLRALHLQGNLLQTLPSLEIASIKQLRINHNPLNCDCRLRPLLRQLRRWGRRLPKHALGICRSPEPLVGIQLATLSPKDLKCERPTSRLVEDDETRQKLICPLAAERQEKPVWLYKNVEVSDSILDAFEIDDKDGSLLVDSLRDVSLFSCTADRQIVRRVHKATPRLDGIKCALRKEKDCF